MIRCILIAMLAVTLAGCASQVLFFKDNLCNPPRNTYECYN